MTRSEEARLLVNAIRSHGWRIYATVVIEGEGVPGEMTEARDKLEAELLILLSDLRDPEYRAASAAKTIIGNAKMRVGRQFALWLVRRLMRGG